MNPELGVPTICVVWDGQRDISRNIICNKEKLDIGGKIVDGSEVPHFTLDEGVRFAEAMLKRSCEEREECGTSMDTQIRGNKCQGGAKDDRGKSITR